MPAPPPRPGSASTPAARWSPTRRRRPSCWRSARRPPLASLDAGTEEEPQRAATLILQVAGLSAGAGWRLTGPGIAAEHRLAVAGLPAGFAAAWAANGARFPRGVDLILCAGARLAALPRTTRIGDG